MTTDARQQHLERNYEAFKKMSFPDDQTGMFALMRNQKVVDVFEYLHDAMEKAQELFNDTLFSVQEINPPPLRISIRPAPRQIHDSEISPQRARELDRHFQDVLSGKTKLPEIKISYRPQPDSNRA